MNDFVEQCRREWKRLRVPDSVVDEMTAELAADLKEAEAEGATVEDVLGSGASDARLFAGSWAAERGVIPSPRFSARVPRGALMVGAIAALTAIAAIGAALVIFASPSAPGTAIRVPAEFSGPPAPGPVRVVRVAPPPAFVRPRAPGGVWIQRDGRVLLAEPSGSGVEINKVGSLLLIVGLAGIVPSMLFLLWPSRQRRDYSF